MAEVQNLNLAIFNVNMGWFKSALVIYSQSKIMKITTAL